ncbi:hypothetical protein ABEB36_002845 [Hypothenemus hampei]|uniref:Nuclear receptor coactivator 2 n=1 Tax=Hypothenemus hampei TaxID=57062 RepID=A0ABD1FAV4_HYPHA
MLEHSAMYLNVTPPYEEDASFFPDFYTRVGSCELQDPVWAKMNALTGIKQKRKKSENKPQTQINKCNNEKRRREQENIYIEELAELISANFADMSSLSVKPDKCAILQETVNQIRKIKQQDNADQQIVDPVQQGEVSSSRPTILSNEVYGPLLLEALEGFLFVVNSEGKVEHVTENVTEYIKYTKDEIIGKTIYNFIHPGDHTKFHSNLLPMRLEWGSDQPTPTRSKSIDARFLLKVDDDLDETVEEKTQRIPYYELMHISSTQLRDNLSVSEEDGSDSGPCLLCVASRISHRDKAVCLFEQFTTKLDISGKIVGIDTSGVTDSAFQVLRKDCKGRAFVDFVPAQDVQKVAAHFKETLNSGTSVSSVYRFQIATDKFVTVQTKSKFFKVNPHGNIDSDFIMATHTVISDNDTLDPGGGIGGPLMTSIVNGTGALSRNGPLSISDAPASSSASSGSGMIQTSSSAGPFTPEFLDNDFPSLDFPTTTSGLWDLEPAWSDTARPNSRQSLTPVSTPTSRPPSNPSYSNAPTIAQSPMPHYSTQASPANQTQQSQSNNFMSFGMMDEFQEQSVYNNEDQKETKPLEETVNHVEPQRLRSLLTNPLTSNAGSSNSNSQPQQQQQDDTRDRILKELLNQPDDDQGGRVDNSRNNSRLSMNRGPIVDQSKSTASSSTGNDMLRRLLNEKNDNGDFEAKTGMKKGSELLQQLLKKASDDDDEKKNENNPHDDALLRTLGFPSASPNADRRGSKRSMDEKDERDSKRTNNGSQVSSSGSSEKSELYQRNKMLASLLENPTPTPPSIPPIPASVISATPQEKLPRVNTDPAKLIGGTMAQNNNTRHNNANRMPPAGRHQITTYLNNNNNFQRPVPGGLYNNQATSTSENIWGDNNNIQADPDLSDILDTVLDFVPETGVLQLLDAAEGQQANSSQISEMAAIKNIQNLLMQCEKAVPSPNVSLPARPPAYNTNNYPPPPNYPQAKYPRQINVRGAGGPQFANANINTHQLLLEQQRKMQQEHKRRLLQQQKQQQLLIPSNATAADINSIQNIDSLLNNTVAPNVTLQRSNSIPESQLSPNYSNQMQGSNSMNQSNQRGVVPQPNQNQPYSPHSQMPSPLGQQNFQAPSNASGGNYNPQRLSPQSQFNSQLSPRQSYPSQGNGSNWQQQQQQRLTVQNPMLNAQLTRPSTQQSQQQRSLNSPGGVPGGSRHSPFAGEQFAQPTSPGAAYNQTQYLQRLQRANSVPTTSSPMTGVAGSNPTSEFVRQELRAVVGARTGQAQPAVGQRSGPSPAQQMQQMGQQGAVDLDSLMTFDMPGASESPKLWGAMGSEMGSMSPQPATSRTSMEEGRPGDHAKTSLLQQLLSEQSK